MLGPCKYRRLINHNILLESAVVLLFYWGHILGSNDQRYPLIQLGKVTLKEVRANYDNLILIMNIKINFIIKIIKIKEFILMDF